MSCRHVPIHRNIGDISAKYPDILFPANKLFEPNYMDWKRNLDIVLTLEELKWVTQEIGSSTPNEHSTQEERDNYHSR